jgi:hypothetical protein
MKLPKIDLSNIELPTIDLSFLPDLETLTGLYGSFIRDPGHDDSILILMTFLYESNPG